MSRRSGEQLVGEVLEEDVQLTFAELAQTCRVSEQQLLAIMNEGVIAPVDGDGAHWLFGGASLKRVLTIIRLEEELGVNLAGAVLAIDLLEEINRLKSLLHRDVAAKGL